MSRGSGTAYLTLSAVDLQARNFLVFQGDVESIAQKAPKDLTQLFEQVRIGADGGHVSSGQGKHFERARIHAAVCVAKLSVARKLVFAENRSAGPRR